MVSTPHCTLLWTLSLLMLATLDSCGFPESWFEEELNHCAIVCQNHDCGEVEDCDCGQCPNGSTCNYKQQCISCEQACDGRSCGSVLECHCGQCSSGLVCANNQCLACEQACHDLICGTALGCDCGQCPSGTECNSSGTYCNCVPQCTDSNGALFQCGPDGCGETCGFCEYGECIGNSCYCEPQCSGMECGPDSCGGYCGPCPENMPVCKAFHCYEACKEEDVSFEIVFPVQVLKISSMKIGQGGHFGEALDVDGDPNTCAPVGDCGNGLDNQLSGLYSQLNMFFDINMELASSLSTGSLVQLFETVGEVTVNQPFSMRLHDGIAAAAYPECNTSEPGCAYLINSAVMTFPDCKTYEIADCTVNEDGVLHAGGVEVRGLMVFPLAFQDTGTLLSPYNFQIVAHATVDSGQVVALDNGIIAGAFRKQDILDLVDEIPTTIDSPISRGMLKNLYDMFVVPDIDTDDDGVLDAASLSYTFESVSGTAVDMEYVPKGYTP